MYFYKSLERGIYDTTHLWTFSAGVVHFKTLIGGYYGYYLVFHFVCCSVWICCQIYKLSKSTGDW